MHGLVSLPTLVILLPYCLVHQLSHGGPTSHALATVSLASSSLILYSHSSISTVSKPYLQTRLCLLDFFRATPRGKVIPKTAGYSQRLQICFSPPGSRLSGQNAETGSEDPHTWQTFLSTGSGSCTFRSLRHSPIKQRQGVGLVVVFRVVPKKTSPCDHQ